MKPGERFTPTDDRPYTKVPNAFIDYWLARLPAAEVRVWLFGCRQTTGFQKEEDAISVKQITDGVFKKDGTRVSHGTGLKRRAAFRALEQLEKQGLVRRVSRPGLTTKYRFLCPEPVQPTARVPVQPSARGDATQCTPLVHSTAHTKEIVDRNPTKESRKAKINGVSLEAEPRKTNGNYQATVAEAEALRALMFEHTGKTETVETALGWLRLAQRADGWADIEQRLRGKLASHKPRSNAWFRTVLANEFGLSPHDTALQILEVTQRYREAIKLKDPQERSLKAQRCMEQAQAHGIAHSTLMNAI